MLRATSRRSQLLRTASCLITFTCSSKGSDTSDCKDFIKRAKQDSGFYYSQHYRAKLWQRYSFEHVLRDDEKSVTAARYVVLNPVRAGLVKRVEEYPYVGSLVFPLPALVDWIGGG